MNKQTKKAGKRLSLVAVGDIYIKREDAISIMALVKSYLKEADFTLGNQEAPLSDRGISLTARLGFRSKPSAVEALSSVGFDAVGLANNHTMDYGAEALLQTIEVLDSAGIAHVGAGRNLAEAHKPAIVERAGTRVALLSYSSVFQQAYAAKKEAPGIAVVGLTTAYQPHPRVIDMPGAPATALTFPNQDDLKALVQDIKNARDQADIVVLSWHWGISQGYRDYVSYQIELGHLAIDSGADLIFGHHSHHLLGIEAYKGKVIFYDMGNFAMELGLQQTSATETLMLRCQISNNRIQRVAFLPVRVNTGFNPQVLDTKRGRDIVEMVERLSERFGTHFKVEPEEVVIGTKP